MKKIGIVIPAGGMGTRMDSGAGSGVPKQFMLLGGEPVLAYAIRAFRSVMPGADIVVALPAGHIETWAGLCLDHDVPPHKIVEGGATRFGSVLGAMNELDPECEYIAVHDAARPLVSAELILRTLEVAKRHGTAVPVLAVTDSIRRVRDQGEQHGDPGSGSYPENRTTLRAVQTPQVFRADILRAGYGRAAGDDYTDDATVIEAIGYNIMLCEGERRNIKITNSIDMVFAEAVVALDRERY